jgi:hypothetical protein
VTLKAFVTPSQQGTLAPVGSVQFADDGNPIASCDRQPLGPSSTATCTVAYATPGSHAITASYGGDGSFGASTSGAMTVAVQPLGTIAATMQWTFYYTPAYTRVLALIVNGAPPGATVLVKCHGHGCPFANRTVAATSTRPCGPKGRHRCATHGTIDLTPRFRRRRLRVGARITVEIIEPGWVGKYYMFAVRARRKPLVQIACTAPGNTSISAGC